MHTDIFFFNIATKRKRMFGGKAMKRRGKVFLNMVRLSES